MFFCTKKSNPKNLTALKFSNPESFRRAARIAVEKNISVDAPGNLTLIIGKKDKKHFVSLNYKETRVAKKSKDTPKLMATTLFELFLLELIKRNGGTMHIARFQNELSEGPPHGIVHRTIDKMIADKKLRLLSDGQGRVALSK